MCPTLSRENYFLTVINEAKRHEMQSGGLEQEMREVLLTLAESVRSNQVISRNLLHRVNQIFEAYQAIRLKVSLVSKMEDLFVEEHKTERAQRQIVLHTEFVDKPDQLKRRYMEAIISLLEAIERNPSLNLLTCIHCGDWYIPYPRAKAAKFCSSNCRNRHHYLHRKAIDRL